MDQIWHQPKLVGPNTAQTKFGWTKYGPDQIWVGPNMGPTKYAGPNLVRPKMADQKCLDQIWLDTISCEILLIV